MANSLSHRDPDRHGLRLRLTSVPPVSQTTEIQSPRSAGTVLDLACPGLSHPRPHRSFSATKIPEYPILQMFLGVERRPSVTKNGLSETLYPALFCRKMGFELTDQLKRIDPVHHYILAQNAFKNYCPGLPFFIICQD